jgi:5'-3' exonuclease
MLQLLDLAGIYFRAFFAVPTSTTSPDGRPVNAIRGSLDIIARVMADARPSRVIACLDLDWRPAWRVELIDTYKTHRVLEAGAAQTSALAAVPEALTGALAGTSPHSGTPGPSADIEVVPDELSPQVPILLDTLAAIGITVAGAAGYEADDVIGTLAAAETMDPVEVVTGDRDLFQVARDDSPAVTVRYIGAGMSKAKVYTAADVATRYGIPAGAYADFAALRGDPSDGLPGVPGVGEKTAATLIGRFGSIEGLVEALDSRNTGLAPGVRTKLANARDYLLVAPKVVRVATDAAVTVEPADDGALPPEPVDPGALSELVRAHGIGGPVNRLLQALAAR